eukprot:TRINITY_DN696_c1_g1_i1.p1 TRINITY_DN696_c1_g1~~TRINITY_DN696_c1_g1_i1.p1  ORF type:complete len:517 (-),score=74.53 TRINITY_DN696_c1_g1_i1:102-1652(-)
MSREITREELSKHNTGDDLWVLINGVVYNVTQFKDEHPGGKKILMKYGGKDASVDFVKYHSPSILQKYGNSLQIGIVSDGSTTIKKNSSSAVVDEMGDQFPYADPSWYQGWHNLYYNDSHKKFRAAVREWTEKEIMPFTHEWETQGHIPKGLALNCYEAGFLPGVIGPPWPTEYVGSRIGGGVKPEEFDSFHELILFDELCRCGSAGIVAGLTVGLSIGLPPIIKFGSDYLKKKCSPCLKGEKIICLAITGPEAGSDVASIQTTAVKTSDGKHYLVNGQKKWISNGVWADFFTTAVRTGGPGMEGLSFLLIDKTLPGVSTRRMHCQGSLASGTTIVLYEDVLVPVENLIGEENKGFKYIMYNFNHERWVTCVKGIRFARVCIEDSFKYAFKRITFGKRLIDHPVIRNKLAHMVRHVEASQSWLDMITLQMVRMSREEANVKLGGSIALLKAQMSQTFELCAREASQIFGGLSYTRGGQAERVERLYREVRALAIPAGSEEIMLDLGIRQAMKRAKI